MPRVTLAIASLITANADFAFRKFLPYKRGQRTCLLTVKIQGRIYLHPHYLYYTPL